MKVVVLICMISWLPSFSAALSQTNAKLKSNDFSSSDILRYASEIAPLVAGRPLSLAEREKITKDGYQAFDPILKAWTQSPFFPRLARQMVVEFTRAGGKSESFDPELPGNLAEFLAREKRPYSELITANSCYDKTLTPIACDTGAPYTAGLLTTRSYLKAHVGRFNLSRAIGLMEDFICKGYPMPDDFQPREALESLIPLFARTSDVPETAPNSLGFGRANCYNCHGQFSAHTQFFVKFDGSGLYHPDADGQQNVSLQPGESGTSQQNLFTSHFKDPNRSKLESSQIFGKPAANLREAAAVIVTTRQFRECAIRRVSAYGARLEKSKALTIDAKKISELTDTLEQTTLDPTFADLFYIVFKHPPYISAVLGKS